eukprot:COSAG03_NODE_403_length_8183_cov_30.968209_3_plen_219_part_00
MPVIGITTSLSAPAGQSQSVPIAYASAIADAGGTPLLLPMLQHDNGACARIIAICDGLVIVGGGVISKGMVGSQPDDLSDTPTLRDESDTAYLSLAMSAKKPVLGICYGMQFINAHLGGGITADWQAHMGGGAEHAHSPSRDCNEHPLGALLEGSKIARILHGAAPGTFSQTYGSILTVVLHSNDVPCCWNQAPHQLICWSILTTCKELAPRCWQRGS